MRLIIDPIENVTLAPIITYHVTDTVVNRETQRIADSPANMAMSAPRAFAPRSSVPRRNRPSKLPNGSGAIVSPVSSSGPHFFRPNAINTRPHARVLRPESFKKLAELADVPRRREKPRTLEAASELSEPL